MQTYTFSEIGVVCIGAGREVEGGTAVSSLILGEHGGRGVAPWALHILPLWL